MSVDDLNGMLDESADPTTVQSPPSGGWQPRGAQPSSDESPHSARPQRGLQKQSPVGGLKSRFGLKGKGSSPAPSGQRPEKIKAPKAAKDGPTMSARLGESGKTAGKRVGATVQQALNEYHHWAAVFVFALLVPFAYQVVRNRDLTLREVVISLVIGAVLVYLLLWLELQARKLHRKPGAFSSLLAAVVLFVVVAIVAAILVKRPDWYPGVAGVLALTFVTAGLVHYTTEAAARQEFVAAADDKARQDLLPVLSEIRGVLATAQSTQEGAVATANAVTTTMTEVNGTIPKLNEAILSVNQASESAHAAALAIKAKRADQKKERDDAVAAEKEAHLAEWNESAKSRFADHITGREELATQHANQLKDGEIAQIQRTHAEELAVRDAQNAEREADADRRHAAEVAGLREEIARLQSSLANYQQQPIRPSSDPASVPNRYGPPASQASIQGEVI